MFSNFVAIFADFGENADKRCNFSKFLDFNLIFIMKIDYTTDLFNFRLNFQFNFHRAAFPKVRMASGD